MLDDTVRCSLVSAAFNPTYFETSAQGNSFSSFATTLTQTARRAGQAFGIGQGSLKTWRIAMYVVGVFILFWISSKLFWWWTSSGQPAE